MNRLLLFICFISSLLTHARAHVADTLKNVTVTSLATKRAIPTQQVTRPFYKIDSAMIGSYPARSVSDLLQLSPSVQITGAYGNLGNNLSLFLRGASSYQTLILIDGVPYNDPTGINQFYDLRAIPTEQIASIELLRGANAILYGTGSAAGIINIKLKKPARKRGAATLSYGSFGRLLGAADYSNVHKKVGYGVNVSHTQANGVSAAFDKNHTHTFDNDGFRRTNVLARVNYSMKNSELKSTFAFSRLAYDYDGGAFKDNDATAAQDQFRGALGYTQRWKGGKLHALFSTVFDDRTFNAPNWQPLPPRSITSYKGVNLAGNLYATQQFANFTALLGADVQHSIYQNPNNQDTLQYSYTNLDPYFLLSYLTDKTNLQLGGRLNNNSIYESNFVWSASASYTLLKQTTVFASYATSFVVPSLYQLLHEQSGNRALMPETSATYEVGARYVNNRMNLEASYFSRDVTHRIDWVNGKYTNTPNTQTVKGVELSAIWTGSQHTASANYTYLPEDLLRVAKHRVNAALSLRLVKRTTFVLTYSYFSARRDSDFSDFLNPVEVNLPSFHVLNFRTNYQYKNFTLFGELNNLTNSSVQHVLGYTFVGLNYNIGLTYRL